MEEKKNYFNLAGFKDVFLEDSFVLEIKETSESIVFTIETILTKNHSLYEDPKPEEFYCYKKAQIQFLNLSSVDWIKKNLNFISSDANNQSDLGNIDSFYYKNKTYHLEGDWGEVEIKCDDVKLNFLI